MGSELDHQSAVCVDEVIFMREELDVFCAGCCAYEYDKVLVPMPVHRGSNITTILHPGCFKGIYIYISCVREIGAEDTFTCRKCKNLDNPPSSIRESQRYLAATQYLVRACVST